MREINNTCNIICIVLLEFKHAGSAEQEIVLVRPSES